MQKTIELTARARGFHLITGEVRRAIPELADCQAGILHVFVRHTSASLTINENADPTVRADMEKWVSRVAPRDFPYAHDTEGPDDMPAHLKASLMGSTVSIPVSGGEWLLGTWQGIYLGEHRDDPTPRELILTLIGEIT